MNYRILVLLAAAISTLSIACQNIESAEKPTTEGKELITDGKNSLQLPDSLSSRRVAFALELRKAVAKRCWPDFAKKRTEGSFIYFNRDQSEVFFPSDQLIAKLDTFESYSPDYLLAPRTDTIPYHFELMVSLDSNEADKVYFEHPVQQFLSVEETGHFIPSVQSTEM